jgi:hypothetical protein
MYVDLTSLAQDCDQMRVFFNTGEVPRVQVLHLSPKLVMIEETLLDFQPDSCVI